MRLLVDCVRSEVALELMVLVMARVLVTLCEVFVNAIQDGQVTIVRSQFVQETLLVQVSNLDFLFNIYI